MSSRNRYNDEKNDSIMRKLILNTQRICENIIIRNYDYGEDYG